MFRKKELWLLFLLCGTCVGVLALGMSGLAQAAYPAARAIAQYNDPYHHLSGVVAIPPSRMVVGSGSNGPSGGNEGAPRRQWAGPLTPPVFGPNVDATNNDSAAQNETTVSINPDNNQIIIGSANDYRANLKPELYRTTDGGTTWANYQVPGAGTLFYGDPAVTSDHNNYSYFSYLGYTSLCSGLGGMYASHSTDAGATMSPPIQLAANSVDTQTAIFNDKEYVAVDSNPASPNTGNVYVAWTRFIFQAGANCGGLASQLGAPVVISRSTDHGVTWTAPITASQVFSNNNSFVSPVTGRHGEVYLYYLGAATQQQPNYDTVLFSRSTDGGQTFPFFTHISSMTDLPSPLPPTNFRNNGGGSMAADQQIDNYLYAVWADYRPGDADILLSRSTDNGDTWGAPVRLNDDPLGNGKDQFFPWIASAPDGYIHVGWFDRREDSTNHNYKEYYTYSSDHGATWAANIAVSSAPSVPGNSNFIGDYSGISASTGVVMPMWTDIRAGGNQNAYVARGDYTAGSPTPTATGTPPTATSTLTPSPTGTRTPTNGPQATNTPTNTNTPLPAATSTPAPNVTLYDQYNNDAGSGSNSQEFEAANAAYDDQIADDFVVPQGQTWEVSEVDFAGQYFNCPATCGTATSFNVFFYRDSSTLPAAPVYTSTGRPYTNSSGNFVVQLPVSAALMGGGSGTTYWVSVQARMDFSTAGQFGWEDRTVQSNNGAAYRNPGGGFACSSNDWLRKPDCVMTTQPDQVFRLMGTLVGGSTATATVTPIRTATATSTGTSTGTPTEVPSVTPTACTIQFTDVPPGSTFYPYIHCLVCLGIVNGYSDGTFKPNSDVTRGQLSKIVANSAGFNDTPTGQQFQDVPISSTFYVYIYRLVLRGYINGYPCGAPPAEACVPPANLPYFLPNANATRGQISKIVSNAAGFNDPPNGQQFQDVATNSTFYPYIYRLSTRSIINGYPCGGAGEPCMPPANLPYFRPSANATRGQMSKIDAAAFFPGCSPPAR